MSQEDIYNTYLHNALQFYYSNDEFIKYYTYVPKSRDYTFKYCLDYLKNKNDIVIVELGTSRSFTDGRFEGCNSNDVKYWEENNPDKWDWSAGCFTRYFSELLTLYNKSFTLYTIDLENQHLERCKTMTKKFDKNIKYIHTSSEDFLKNCSSNFIDLLYLDTGDMTPIEPTANLHLNEAKLIVEKNILKNDGLILIDDVRNPVPKRNNEVSDYGKAKYSLPYFLNNGFKIIENEYQVILSK